MIQAIKADRYYLENLHEIKTLGSKDEFPRPRWEDGTPAHSYFITQVFEKYNLAHGEFPLTTLRNTATKKGIAEILWIYQKQSNELKVIREMGVDWWDNWNVGDDTIGKRYGYVVKELELIDNLLKGLKEDPFGRRHIMNLWQEEYMEGPGLKPCAYETLWSCRKVNGKIYLDLTLNQRSNDYIMAGYINKIQYVALQMMIANSLGYEIGNFVHFVQNLHVYDRHVEAMYELLKKEPLNIQPKLILKRDKGFNFFDYTVDDFVITGVKEITKIKSPLEIAV